MIKSLIKYAVPIVAIILWTSSVTAQHRCNFDHEHEEKLKDPQYQEFLDGVKSEIKRLRDEGRIACSVGTITFPVAIHYNWTGVGTTVDQCMIDAAISSIDALNDDYGGTNSDLSDYDDLTATCAASYPASAKSDNSCIQFCIAEYDHPGCSGLCDGDLAITAGTFEYPNTGGCYGDYINIFVQSGTGQLGIAPLSGVVVLGGNGPQVDASTWGGPGILCTPNGLGNTFNSNTSYNLGRTLTHEMGHYFGLQHVFAGDCTTDDGYADTPIQSDENFGTPSVVNCDPADAGNTAVNSCSTLDMWCSYMDYSNDTHLFMFTTDQSTDMYDNAQLSPIADSAVKCDGTPSAPTADFNVNGDLPVFCTGDAAPYTIDFEDNSTRCPTSWSWTFTGAGATPSTSTDEDPTITVTETGALTVTLTATNGNGTSAQFSKDIYVQIAEAGSCPDCGDKFYDSGGPDASYSNNESNFWTYCADAGELITMNANSVDLSGGLFTDGVRIYDGDTNPPADLNNDIAILGQNNGSGGGFWEPSGGSYSYQGTTWTSPSNCVTMWFSSDGSSTGTGWDVDMTCCPDVADPECSQSNTDGLEFTETISSYCNTQSIFDLDFKDGGIKGSDDRTPCAVISLPYANNSYYEVTCDGDGGDLEVDVTIPAENTGNVKAFIMGPLTGECPSYTSGNLTSQDCEEGTSGTLNLMEPGVAAGNRYLIVINSEDPGSFEIVGSGTALPVELVSFDASVRNTDVILTWETSSEVNNNYYTVERSLNGYDYEAISRVEAEIDAAFGANYNYTDVAASTGANYYRLLQTDIDGSSKYIGDATAFIRTAKNDFTVYPNPGVGDKLHLDGLSPNRTYSINITNATGDAFIYNIEADSRGEGSLILTNVPLGVYFISAANGTQIEVVKYIKLK